MQAWRLRFTETWFGFKETIVKLLEQVCKDTVVEPGLLNITSENLWKGTYASNGAHLDISTRGFWTPLDRAFTDVRVIHPQAQYNAGTSLAQMYRKQWYSSIHQAQNPVWSIKDMHYMGGKLNPRTLEEIASLDLNLRHGRIFRGSGGVPIPQVWVNPPENVNTPQKMLTTPQNLTEKSENSKKVRLPRAYSWFIDLYNKWLYFERNSVQNPGKSLFFAV